MTAPEDTVATGASAACIIAAPSHPHFWVKVPKPIYTILFCGDKNLFERATGVNQPLTTHGNIPKPLSLSIVASRAQKFLSTLSNFLANSFDCHYVPVAQIRTCLWPCVDR